MGNEVVEVVDVSVVEAQDRALIDSQIATAKAYPRVIEKFKAELEEWSCSSEEIAEECYYRLTRGDTSIEGPSVRFAELLAASYGNLICQVQILPDEKNFVVAEATVRDAERNLTQRSQVRRRITTNSGQRYGTDMIGVTAQAAAAIALRNAITSVVPKALWNPIWLKSKQKAIGKGSLQVRRTEAIKFLAKLGASEAAVLFHFGKAKKEDLSNEDVLELRQTALDIKQGKKPVEKAFPEPGGKNDKEAPKQAASAAGEALSKSKKKAPAKKGKEPETAEDGAEIPDDF